MLQDFGEQTLFFNGESWVGERGLLDAVSAVAEVLSEFTAIDLPLELHVAILALLREGLPDFADDGHVILRHVASHILLLECILLRRNIRHEAPLHVEAGWVLETCVGLGKVFVGRLRRGCLV